jgi:hypothetical protein
MKRDDRLGKVPRPPSRSVQPDRQPARPSKSQADRKPAKPRLPAVGPRIGKRLLH